MVETTRSNAELRKDVDALKDSLDELKSMMASVIAHQNQQNLGASVGHSGENGGDLNGLRGGGGYQIPTKEEYIRALNDRFGALVYDDPMSELVNLKQVGNIQNYLDRFDEIVNCLDLPDHYVLSCFLGGLKREISVPVRMFRPKSLQEAISLAKLQ
ncbi:hypothetical protein BUALT_Bualt11G0098700 [Buddleja alternifolia]|uniref:Retrotransposon gag domain-containing protein n=1 Tax=Buddleja alternifolia TaxID=168488 RepID=A0AAV6WUS8_9LAMI|nr:hypothetical protein BUALT_Bualt11G0098700 [Buddleja alternifolia]